LRQKHHARLFSDGIVTLLPAQVYEFIANGGDRRAALVMSGAAEPVSDSSGWASVELPAPLQPRTDISHVLFDFDGTLSLIRQGWPEVMVPMFVEVLPRVAGETKEDVEQMVLDDIMRLNGKQTIYQMIQLAERIKERGGQPREPLWYKHEYLRRLEAHIGTRAAGLKNGTIAADTLLVHGARALLEHLRDRGLELYLASGTDLSAVKQEAALLDLTGYFGPNIYGALDDYKQFSKKMIIDRILNEHNINGRQLLSFGDGYVEIENTKEVGGLAVAVASDEAHNGSGQIDQWKRARLLGVGADAVIPDFRGAISFVDFVLGRQSQARMIVLDPKGTQVERATS
jgi:phosphoglycolate phosphatase